MSTAHARERKEIIKAIIEGNDIGLSVQMGQTSYTSIMLNPLVAIHTMDPLLLDSRYSADITGTSE